MEEAIDDLLDVYKQERNYVLNINSLMGDVEQINDYDNNKAQLTIPEIITYDSKQYTVVDIGYHAFSNCNALTNIKLPNSITGLGDGAFNNCTSLQKIIFEDPSNWNCIEMQYDAIYDLYRAVYIPIEEDLSNPEIAAQLLTSTYVDDILQKIE